MKDKQYPGYFKSFNQLLADLVSLKNQGYVFRGEAQPDWALIPKFMRNTLPNFYSQNENFKQYIINFQEKIPKKIWDCYSSLGHQFIERIFHVAYFISKYNYNIGSYQEASIPSIPISNVNSPSHYKTQEKFNQIAGFLINTLTSYISLDGSFLKKGLIISHYTSYEQGFAQHYSDIGSNLLDFSFNPDIAFFFATYKINKKILPKFLVIYAIKEKNKHPGNLYRLRTDMEGGERCIKQEGLFLECNHFIAYYLICKRSINPT